MYTKHGNLVNEDASDAEASKNGTWVSGGGFAPCANIG